jgi:cytochrome o ubiquinol oxidase subunit 2
LIIWSAPLLIIICLGALTWMGTHLLDPFRPLGRTAPGQTVAHDTKTLKVNVVALDWKWLFIYPDYGIATVNELAAPVGKPIDFRITSSSVMNSFFIPALAGQVYAMPGMQTKLHAVINKPGVYDGFSANYSGSGFSGMRFAFHGQAEGDFDKWVAEVRTGGGKLGRAEYLQLEKPSENVPVIRFGAVEPGLYKAILNMCVEPGKMCMNEMSAIDAKGGLGLSGIRNVLPLEYDKYARRGSAALVGSKKTPIASICTKTHPQGADSDKTPAPVKAIPVLGAGLPRPGLSFQSSASPRPSNS